VAGALRSISSGSDAIDLLKFILAHNLLFHVPETIVHALRASQKSIACIEDPFRAATFGSVYAKIGNSVPSSHLPILLRFLLFTALRTIGAKQTTVETIVFTLPGV
jgi:hypothetical protein